MAKQKIFITGETFDVTNHLAVAELLIQDRLDCWLGKGTVTVKLNKPTADEIELTIYRKYGEFYKPPTGHSFFQSIFTYDQQILLGKGYRYGSVADLSSPVGGVGGVGGVSGSSPLSPLPEPPSASKRSPVRPAKSDV